MLPTDPDLFTSPEFHFSQFYHALTIYRPTLSNLTEQTWNTSKEWSESGKAKHDAIAARLNNEPTFDKFVPLINDLYHRRFTWNVFGAAAVLVLDDLCQTLAARLNITPRGTELNAGPQVNGVLLTSLLNATGNNFRHHEEWACIPQPYTAATQANFPRAFKSINVLVKALQMRIIDRVVAGQVLDILSRGDYRNVEAQMLQAAEDLGKTSPRLLTAQATAFKWATKS